MTGAVLDGTNLKVTNAGTVKLLATIKDGKKTGVDFTQEFTVIVKAADYTKVTWFPGFLSVCPGFLLQLRTHRFLSGFQWHLLFPFLRSL